MEKQKVSGSGTVASLEGLRGAAALGVLFFHLWSYLEGQKPELGWIALIAQKGWMGVDIFFVLSGFLLTRHFMSRSRPFDLAQLNEYISHRILRIAPAYYFQLAILFFLSTAKLTDTQVDLEIWLSLLVWGQSFLYPLTQPVNPVYWTLPTEWAFYLSLPLIVTALRRRYIVVLLVGAVSVVVTIRYGFFLKAETNVLSINDRAQLLGQFPCRLDQFIWGASTAWISPFVLSWIDGYSARCHTWFSNVTIGVGVIGAALLAHTTSSPNFWTTPGWVILLSPLLAPFICLIILGACSERGHASQLLSTRPLVSVGRVSYSLYLWHFPILSWLLLNYERNAYRVTLALLVIVLVTVASYFLFERPFIKIRKSSAQTMKWIQGKVILFFLLVVVLFGAVMIFMKNLPAKLDGACPDFGEIDRMEVVVLDQQQVLISGWVAHKENLMSVRILNGTETLAQAELLKTDRSPPLRDDCLGRRMSRFQSAISIGVIAPSTVNIDVVGVGAGNAMFRIKSIPFHAPPLLGNVDLKKYENGTLTIEGWILSASGWATVAVLDRNGKEIATSNTGIVRSDVMQAWPAWNGASSAGFKLQVPMSRLEVNRLQVEARNGQGDKLDLSSKKSR